MTLSDVQLLQKRIAQLEAVIDKGNNYVFKQRLEAMYERLAQIEARSGTRTPTRPAVRGFDRLA